MQNIKTEVKIGIIVISTLAVIIWGINFLKGKYILNRSDVYYAVFENTQGIDVSAPVVINGFKVGMVSNVKFAKGNLDKIIIAFTVDDKYNIPEKSVVELHSADIMGTKALRILPSKADNYHNYGDTLITETQKDIIASLTDDLMPLKLKAESAIEEIDSLISSLNYVLDTKTSDDLKSAINNLSMVSSGLQKQMEPEGDLNQTFRSLNLISRKLSDNRSKLDTIFSNFLSISDSVAQAQIGNMIKSINSTFSESSLLLEKINRGEGSLGLLTTNDSLYRNLNSSIESLDVLLEDLNKNPKRYVHFSVFGGKNKDD